jgi:hypothetical protein
MSGLSIHKGVLLIALLAILTGTAALVGGGAVLGTVCALVLLFVLPGVAVAFYAPLGATPAERVGLMLGLGIAAVILASIGLAALDVRLDATTWVLALGNLSLLGCVVAVLVSPRRGLTEDSRPRRASLGVSRSNLAAALGAIVLLVIAGVVTIESKHAQDRKAHFTQLWTLPQARGGAATIGVGNREAGVRSYVLQARSGGRLIASWGPVSVASGDVWERQVQAPLGTKRLHVVLEGKGEGETIHRSTSVTVG